MAGAAGDQRKRGAAVNARPGVGGMGDGRFVAEVQDADAGAGGRREDFVEVIADQRKDGVDSQLHGGCDEQFSACGHRNAMLLHARVSLALFRSGPVG